MIAQLQMLGVEPGGVLLVHAAFRAVRPVEGGPLGLIGALSDALGPDGTLVMPSWGDDDDTPFDPLTTLGRGRPRHHGGAFPAAPRRAAQRSRSCLCGCGPSCRVHRRGIAAIAAAYPGEPGRPGT